MSGQLGRRRPAARTSWPSAAATAWPPPSAPCAATPARSPRWCRSPTTAARAAACARSLGIPAPGDLRRCLVALAGRRTRCGPGRSSTASRRRPRRPRPRQPGHRRPGQRDRRLRPAPSTMAGRPARRGRAGSCRPPSVPVVLKADVAGARGGRARSACPARAGPISSVSIVPPDAAGARRGARRPSPRPTRSYRPRLAVHQRAGRRAWCRRSARPWPHAGRRVGSTSATSGPQLPETAGYDVAAHLRRPARPRRAGRRGAWPRPGAMPRWATLAGVAGGRRRPLARPDGGWPTIPGGWPQRSGTLVMSGPDWTSGPEQLGSPRPV